MFVWGKPTLDKKQQILRFTDMTLDVDSAAAFGLAGAVANIAIPYLQKSMADKAVIDLKPFAASARTASPLQPSPLFNRIQSAVTHP